MRVLAVLAAACPVALMVWILSTGRNGYPCCEPDGHNRVYWWDDVTAYDHPPAPPVTIVRTDLPPESHIPPAVIPGQVLHRVDLPDEGTASDRLELEGPGSSAD